MHFVFSDDVVKEWVSVCSWCWSWPFVVSTWAAVWWHHQSMSPPTQPAAAPQPSRYHPVSVSLVCGHSWPLSIPSQSWWTNINFCFVTSKRQMLVQNVQVKYLDNKKMFISLFHLLDFPGISIFLVLLKNINLFTQNIESSNGDNQIKIRSIETSAGHPSHSEQKCYCKEDI